MLPTRCVTVDNFSLSVWLGAVAADAISSPPSLMRSNRRVTPPGRPWIVSTGLTIMLTAEVTGRATALPAASANSLVLLMSSSWVSA